MFLHLKAQDELQSNRKMSSQEAFKKKIELHLPKDYSFEWGKSVMAIWRLKPWLLVQDQSHQLHVNDFNKILLTLKITFCIIGLL